MAKEKSTADLPVAVQMTEYLRSMYLEICRQCVAQGASVADVRKIWIGALMGEAAVQAAALEAGGNQVDVTRMREACLAASQKLSEFFPALPVPVESRIWQVGAENN